MTEVFTSLETRNRYSIQLRNGTAVLYAAETGDGAMAFLSRNSLVSNRPFHISLRDPSGGSAMELHRPWRWFFSRLDVLAGDGRPLGKARAESRDD